MKYCKPLSLTFVFSFVITISFTQSFLVLEKMGTKKRYTYNIGEQINYKLIGEKSAETRLLTNILDSAFVSNNDTIAFKAVEMVNIGPKRESTILTTAGPILISAGVVILGIDFINRGLVQEGGYTWDSGIGVTSVVLVTSGVLIMVLRKNKKKISNNGWWRFRKASIY